MKHAEISFRHLLLGIICVIIQFLMAYSVEAQADEAFTLKYVVDRMSTRQILSEQSGSNNTPEMIPVSGRYSVTYRVNIDGSYFLEIFLLDSPWEIRLPHETRERPEEGIRRILLTPEFFYVYNEQGSLLYKQKIQDLSWPPELFVEGFDPLGLRVLLLSEGNAANREHLLRDGGGVIDPYGFVIFQSCGQTGPLRTICDPGDCSRVVYHPDNLRPLMAEHSRPGQEPYYLQYFQWSKDGSSLRKTFEKEMVQLSDGINVLISTVSHYFDFSITK